MPPIYKILARSEWTAAAATGRFDGSPVDLADGFIHFSTAVQAPETARRHFRGRAGLVVIAVAAEALGDALKWEPSRGGALFPHLYGSLPCALAGAPRAAPLGPDGVPELGDLAP
ncbi:MAG: DUF952 domain-containing protein [Caulobacteraceae bacterium]